MLRITIELVPYGIESRKEVIAVGQIHNAGTGTLSSGNYEVILYKKGSKTQVWKQGTIEGFPRQRLGPWDLLFRGLRSLLAKRNP
jgi:hypothetical protein